MFVFNFHACEFTRALEYMNSSRICSRCRGCLVEPGTELEVKGGGTITLCSDCNHDLAGWLQSPPRWAQLEPHEPAGPPTVIPQFLA